MEYPNIQVGRTQIYLLFAKERVRFGHHFTRSPLKLILEFVLITWAPGLCFNHSKQTGATGAT